MTVLARATVNGRLAVVNLRGMNFRLVVLGGFTEFLERDDGAHRAAEVI